MRYLTIPKPVELPATDGQVHQYEFSDLLADQVWCHEFWRASSGRDLSDLFFDLVGKFEFATEAGDVVELTGVPGFQPAAVARSVARSARGAECSPMRPPARRSRWARRVRTTNRRGRHPTPPAANLSRASRQPGNSDRLASASRSAENRRTGPGCDAGYPWVAMSRRFHRLRWIRAASFVATLALSIGPAGSAHADTERDDGDRAISALVESEEIML